MKYSPICNKGTENISVVSLSAMGKHVQTFPKYLNLDKDTIIDRTVLIFFLTVCVYAKELHEWKKWKLGI